jgi:hypothetical protein
MSAMGVESARAAPSGEGSAHTHSRPPTSCGR